MNITNSVTRLVNAYQDLQDLSSKDKQKLADALVANAELAGKLAIELGNNPAEQAAIDKAKLDTEIAIGLAEDAQVKANAYAVEIAKLQAAADVDVMEDTALETLIESVLNPTVVQPEPLIEEVEEVEEVEEEKVQPEVQPETVVTEVPVQTETVNTEEVSVIETVDTPAEEVIAIAEEMTA